jgi:hypothetical protein
MYEVSTRYRTNPQPVGYHFLNSNLGESMKWLALFSFSAAAFAQDMTRLETIDDAYTETMDGGSRYVGKCSTHEDYYKFYYKTLKVIQSYIDDSRLSEDKIKDIIKKLDPQLLKLVLKENGLDNLGEPNESVISIFQNYVDDITIDLISHQLYDGLDLIRFNIGMGGGNGGFTVFNKTKNGFELISRTFDGDLSYCDKKVWLGKR